MKVIFLDRDGIINKERGDYTWKKDQFEFTDNLFSFLRLWAKKGFKFMVITNQGGINKGIYKHEHVLDLHNWMRSKLKSEGIEILDIFYCPHHSDYQKCLCRKPGSQLIEKASALYHVNFDHSIMIGDRERDVEAAKRIGIQGLLVESNPNWETVDLNNLIH